MTYAKDNKVNQTPSLFLHEKGQPSAKPIIFLHGVGSSGNMWSAHLMSFNHYHCIAPDLPGHGKSNYIEWTNLDEVTDMIADIIKKKCNQKAHLVGLSLGGALSANLLVNYPTLVDRAIIDGCSLKPIKGSEGAIIGVSLISPFIHTDLIIKSIAKMVGIPKTSFEQFREDMKAVHPKSFRKAFSNANRIYWPDDVSHIHSPVLFVSGEKESETMHKTHKFYSNKIDGSLCFIYPNKAHGWLAEDVPTHVDMCKYWFDNEIAPHTLHTCK